MRTISKRRAQPSKRKRNPAAEGHHTCRTCPVCGTEECKILQQLGMYCDTSCAVFEAARTDTPLEEKELNSARSAQSARKSVRHSETGS